MTVDQYKQQLRDCFRNDFVSAEQFIHSVLEPLFHEITPLYEDDMLKREEYAWYKTRGLQSVRKVAQITDAFNPIEVYDIVLQESTNIAIARVYIQQFVRSMAIPYSGAFLLFHYANPTNREWRFSYLYKEDTLSSITNAKRYTYLFGQDHTCRTAEERFVELFKQEHIEKQQLLEAFSVETLSKEFFDKYDAIYHKFCKYIIEDHPECFGGDFIQDPTGKTTRDYVKKLLGRITFLCFLQKKRWLNNNLHFMRDLFDKATPQQQANFLDEVLEPLFFDCLNRQRPNDLFNTNVAALGEVHIPYLNGGLFERDKIDSARSQFPAEYFRELLDFYEQYNFTIDENDPNDAEVGVDPEMLGKIFESQLEDNKDKGAFYTPKEIVQYMCRESLITYLTNCAMENTQHKYPREQTEASVRKLVQTPEQIVHLMNDRQKTDFGNALRAVKICDPAIGSGAFPMGLLNELVRLRVSIGAWANKPNDIAALKREIIQNNIYGVDIEQGAIDIARLRFWLSIVVDETEPSPLPNFDYKFMQGNSLVTTFGGEYINLDTKEQSHFKVQEMKEEKQILYNLKQQYYTASGEQKLEIGCKIKDAIIRLISMQLGYESRSWVEQHSQLEMFEEAKQLSFDDIIEQLPEEKKRVINLCKKLHAQLENTSIPLETRAHTDIRFFDWRMMFTEVFDNDKPGFDIVIGNPPYIDSETMTKVMPEMRELYAKQYSCAKGNWDIYITFMELALRLGRIASLITPDKWLSKPFGYEFRKQLMMKRLTKITHAGANVFSSATVDAIITLYNESSNKISGCKFISAEDIKQLSTASMDSIQDPYYIDFLFSNQASLIAKLDKLPLRIKDLDVSCEGACATSDAYKLVPLLNNADSSVIDNNVYYKLVNTGTIVKYAPLWGTKPITYLGSKILCPIVSKDEFNQVFGRTYILRAQRPKIIFKGLNLLDAFIDAKAEFIPGKSTLVICCEDIEKLKFLSAIINSKLAYRYIKIKYQSSSYCGGITFTSDMINLIPLPQLSSAQKQSIIDLVDAILAKKQADPQADTAAEEQAIDQLVYSLYGLEADDINQIESKQ